MKKFVIIDDSALMRRVISDIIRQGFKDAQIKVAQNGLEGYELLQQEGKPDIVILDINMPIVSGLELLARLKKEGFEVPILVVSSVAIEGAKETIRALELGAFDFITKPGGLVELKSAEFSACLLEKVNIALTSKEKEEAPFVMSNQIIQSISQRKRGSSHYGKLIALCCSTGGPKALQRVIPMLKKDMNAPMLIVQHMPAGFTQSLANRLNEISELEVKEAEDGDVLQKGVVYIAKGGYHLELQPYGKDYKIHLTSLPPREGLRPSGNVMYESLCNLNIDEIVCVILTGMGSDGTAGIKELSKYSKITVIAQDAESSVVYGMPKSIYEAGLVDEVVTLDKVADIIMKKVGVQ